MVGIALILDPTLKRDFLRSGLGWKRDWILCVEEHFQSSFLFYKRIASTASSTQEPVVENATENEFLSQCIKDVMSYRDFTRLFNALKR